MASDSNFGSETNLVINADDNYVAFGADGAADSKIYFGGTSLTFWDVTTGAKTLAQLAAGGGSATLDNAFDNGNAIDGATTDAATGLQIGDGTNYVSIYEGDDTHVYFETSVGDIKFISAGGDVDFADDNITTTGVITGDGGIAIGADNVNLTLGASDATDAKIYFDGAGNLTFYDSGYGSTRTLTQLAATSLTDPTITGNMTISDGGVSHTDTADEIAYLLTASGVHTNVGLHVAAITVTSGDAVRVTSNRTNITSGNFLNLYDNADAASIFKVTSYGATTIAGNAGSDMLTVTAGDVQITAGNIDIDKGIITVDNDDDETNYFKRDVAGSATLLEVEQTATSSTGTALLVDQNATGNAVAVNISHDGDGAALSIDAGAARTGNVITIPMANQLAQTAIDITGAATGTNGEGIVHVDVTGALAGNAIRVDSTGANTATGQLLYLSSAGNQAGATEGICAYMADSGNAAATSYVLTLASTNNEAFHVDAGKSLFDEQVAITLADDTGPGLVVTNPDTSGDTNAVSVVPSGAGAGIAITPQETDTQGILVTTVASSTVPLIDIDATTGAGWIGGADAGCIDITCDGAVVADASLLRLASSGQPAAANDGICLDIKETGAAQATSYAMRISSASNEALHVDAGLSLFDERVTITLADDTGPALAITNPDTTGDTNAVTITPSGAGAGLLITPQETDTQGLLITVGAANTTASQLTIDGATADWIGAATTGMLHLTCDAPIVADASLLRIASSGQPAAANDGACLELVETGAAQATSYAMRITSTNNEALHVDAGKVLVDETVTASLGVVTLALDTNTSNPPTDAEIDAVTGADTEVDGCIIFIDDGGAHANAYLCVHDGTKWWQLTMTACA